MMSFQEGWRAEDSEPYQSIRCLFIIILEMFMILLVYLKVLRHT